MSKKGDFQELVMLILMVIIIIALIFIFLKMRGILS